jgi:hypothetical protein
MTDLLPGMPTTAKDQPAVPVPVIRDALVLLGEDRDREDLRPLDPPGNDRSERGATLSGPRYGWVKL